MPDSTVAAASDPVSPSRVRTQESKAPHQIVVVGGGAAGLELATRLGDTLGKRGTATITLIERRAHPPLEAAAARCCCWQHGPGRARAELSRPGSLASLPVSPR